MRSRRSRNRRSTGCKASARTRLSISRGSSRCVEQFLAAVTFIADIDEIALGQRDQPTSSPGRATVIGIGGIRSRKLGEHGVGGTGIGRRGGSLAPEPGQRPARKRRFRPGADEIGNRCRDIAEAHRLADHFLGPPAGR